VLLAEVDDALGGDPRARQLPADSVSAGAASARRLPAGGSDEQVRQEWLHAGGGEQHRGVAPGDEGGAGEDGVSAFGEERREHRPSLSASIIPATVTASRL
jgi:hypothetical protein